MKLIELGRMELSYNSKLKNFKSIKIAETMKLGWESYYFIVPECSPAARPQRPANLLVCVQDTGGGAVYGEQVQ